MLKLKKKKVRKLLIKIVIFVSLKRKIGSSILSTCSFEKQLEGKCVVSHFEKVDACKTCMHQIFVLSLHVSFLCITKYTSHTISTFHFLFCCRLEDIFHCSWQTTCNHVNKKHDKKNINLYFCYLQNRFIKQNIKKKHCKTELDLNEN